MTQVPLVRMARTLVDFRDSTAGMRQTTGDRTRARARPSQGFRRRTRPLKIVAQFGEAGIALPVTGEHGITAADQIVAQRRRRFDAAMQRLRFMSRSKVSTATAASRSEDREWVARLSFASTVANAGSLRAINASKARTRRNALRA